MRAPSATEVVLLLLHGQREPRRYRGILDFHDEQGLWETEPFNLWQPWPPVEGPGAPAPDDWRPITGGSLEVAVDGPAVDVHEVGRGPWLRSDGEAVWRFERDVEISDVPVLGARFVERPHGYRDYLPPFRPSWIANLVTPPLRWFLEPLDAVEIGGRDPWVVAGPVRSTEHLGRGAWVVPLRENVIARWLTVDRETGQLLEVRTDTTRVGWTVLDTEPEFAPGQFGYDGPVHTREEERDRGEAEQEEQRQAGIDTWTRLVGPTEFTVVAHLPLELSVREVHQHDPETGEFSARLAGNHVFLGRTLRGDAQEGSGHHGNVLRWSTPRYDWTIQGLAADVTDSGRQAIADCFPPD